MKGLLGFAFLLTFCYWKDPYTVMLFVFDGSFLWKVDHFGDFLASFLMNQYFDISEIGFFPPILTIVFMEVSNVIFIGDNSFIIFTTTCTFLSPYAWKKAFISLVYSLDICPTTFHRVVLVLNSFTCLFIFLDNFFRCFLRDISSFMKNAQVSLHMSDNFFRSFMKLGGFLWSDF